MPGLNGKNPPEGTGPAVDGTDFDAVYLKQCNINAMNYAT
jgi:hypothetical protein